MGKSKRNKHRRERLADPVAAANAEVRAAEQTLLAKRQAAARAAAAAVNDQTDATPEEQYAAFLNRPGDYYVARFDVGGNINDTQGGVAYVGECVLKADEDQLPYLVEVIRQIRGGFGDQARITLTRAQTTQQHAAPPPATQPDPRPTDLFERAAADLLPDAMQPDIPEPSREEIQQQLPGMTRREVADELGVNPADLGGDIKHANSIDVETLAAELGVSPLDLMPITSMDGSVAYAVKPGAAPTAGRHSQS